MTKSNFLTGAVTFVLLSLIIFVLTWDPGSEPTTSTAQNATPERNQTVSLQRFSLAEMVDRSGKIFRGTVIDFEPGTVSAGGADLPTVTYKIRVEQAFKGTFPSKGDVQYAEVTMLGNIKEQIAQGNIQKLPVLPTPPLLKVGSDYLLMLNPVSSIGLTTPMGLGQGSFQIYSQDKQEWAKNEYNNAGLFDGPVRYDELAAQIQRGGK